MTLAKFCIQYCCEMPNVNLLVLTLFTGINHTKIMNVLWNSCIFYGNFVCLLVCLSCWWEFFEHKLCFFFTVFVRKLSKNDKQFERKCVISVKTSKLHQNSVRHSLVLKYFKPSLSQRCQIWWFWCFNKTPAWELWKLWAS